MEKNYDLWADGYGEADTCCSTITISNPFAGYAKVLNEVYASAPAVGKAKRILDVGFGTGVDDKKKLYADGYEIHGCGFL